MPGMVAYDPANPLHQTGIKMISAKPENATVVPPITYAVEGIAAYGVTTAKFEAPVVVVSTAKFESPGPAILPGDVNGDGNVTSTDITLLYNIILNNDYTGVVNADQNGDGNITSSDVTLIYNILLGSKK